MEVTVLLNCYQWVLSAFLDLPVINKALRGDLRRLNWGLYDLNCKDLTTRPQIHDHFIKSTGEVVVLMSYCFTKPYRLWIRESVDD